MKVRVRTLGACEGGTPRVSSSFDKAQAKAITRESDKLKIFFASGVDQLAALIVDERVELEEEIRALRSLAILARLEVLKANVEREEVEKAFDMVYSSRQKKKEKEKIAELRWEKALIRDDLARSQGEDD
ncbi:hypothetical protein F2P56_035373 [Juglans regia]|uniref:Uncharacterized protein LOC109007476 n=2 Tax=Juglans regia TaxID=51240 RepID=A0A2I4GFM6_JUGRE|nr:uncharacterized protein LOC109007476 [Juglans regia]KAF5442749.1 hypothetical protein F2P56_035373 [Juglans regia]